jgi:hypothetical protein
VSKIRPNQPIAKRISGSSCSPDADVIANVDRTASTICGEINSGELPIPNVGDALPIWNVDCGPEEID